MAVDPRKRQKKLQKRSAKRKEKRHILVREQSLGLLQRQSDFVKYPVLHCTIANSFAEHGNGWVIVSRESSTRQVAVNAFMVDSYCLGVKNVVADIITRTRYDETFGRSLRTEMPSRTVPLAEALKFLEAAVAYARSLGFEPHPDYEKAILLFGDADPAASDAQFTFGKNGKPYFFAGPRDTPERCSRIISILEKNVGPDNFFFTIPISDGASIMEATSSSYRSVDLEDDFEEEEDEDDMPRKSR